MVRIEVLNYTNIVLILTIELWWHLRSIEASRVCFIHRVLQCCTIGSSWVAMPRIVDTIVEAF